MFHVEARSTAAPLKSTEIVTFDGTWPDISQKGSFSLASANGTAVSDSIAFSQVYKQQLESQEWNSNTSFSLAGKTYAGEAIFFGKHHSPGMMQFSDN